MRSLHRQRTGYAPIVTAVNGMNEQSRKDPYNFLMYAINVLQKQKRKTGFIAYHKATVEEIIKYLKKRGK